METIDAIVRRILTEKIRLGPLRAAVRRRGRDRAAGAGHRRAGPRGGAPGDRGARERRRPARSTPRGGSASPLIGPTADDPLALLCGYSFPVHLILNDAGESRRAGRDAAGRVREGLRRRSGSRYAQGCFIIEQRKYGSPVFPGDVEKSTSLDAGLAGLDADGPHPRGGGVRARRRTSPWCASGTWRASSRPAPSARARTPTRSTCRASSSSCSRPWSRPGSRSWSCSRAAARTTSAAWRTRSPRS